MEQLRGIKLKRFKKQLARPNLELVLILENIQYARNVAEIFRIADAVKVKEIALTGISHTPPFGKELQKVSRTKESSVKWQSFTTTGKALQYYQRLGYQVVALELTDQAISLSEFRLTANKKVVLLVGNETYGITKDSLAKVDKALYVPMFGKGASLNVAVSTAICLYSLILPDLSAT